MVSEPLKAVGNSGDVEQVVRLNNGQLFAKPGNSGLLNGQW